ncbi:unnamed protein product [Scytosiphon promiscuus]
MRAFQDMLLGPLKAVVMKVLQQQLSKYIHNIELEELGLMGGDVVLENLELRKDVLHDIGGISTDYDFSRGFIKELRIHIPWTRLQSRPIEIKLQTVEIIITPITQTASQKPGSAWRSRTGQHSRHGGRSTDEQASPAGASGWLQQLLTKVLANMSIEVSNLVLKYEDADVVLSAALKSLVCFSADPDREWVPAFATLDDPFGFLHKLVRASDLTVCLDRYCAPDPTRRRQVQAFEVPLLNRASFEVRLLACVWLVAPGPPESSLAAWEDQGAEWQDGAEINPAGVPPSPGMHGGRSGIQRGAWDSPKPPTTPKTPRSAVTVLGRLVGGDRRGTGADDSMMDGSGSGVAASSWGAEGDFDELPIPTVCRMLRGGWSRRASSSYSPFFDGEGAWSRSEASGVSLKGGVGEGINSSTPKGAGRQEEGDGVGSGGGEGRTMPVPIVAADVFIADLSFSLSNLQVRMMKELIERAVEHVARNARENAPADTPVREPPSPSVPGGAAPVTSSWWPSFWRGTALEDADEHLQEGVEETADAGVGDGTLGRSGSGTFDSREFDMKFVVASASVGSVSLRLLEHQEQTPGEGSARKEGEEECSAAEDEEPESISVPVHGLGTVSVISAPVSARKQALRPPAAFVVAEVKGLVLDAHVLPGSSELSADVKVEVSSVIVRHARLDDAAAPLGKSPEQPETSKRLDDLEPVVSWGTVAPPRGPTAQGREAGSMDAGAPADPRSATKVQQCLIELSRVSPPAGGETGRNAESSGGESTPSQRAEKFRISPSMPWAPVSPRATPHPVSKDCALQYRLLKQKGGGALLENSPSVDGANAVAGAASTLVCHDIAVGALRVQIAEILLEKLLRFSGVIVEENGKNGQAEGSGGAEEVSASTYATGPVSFIPVQGQPPGASRLSLRASNERMGSALSSPRTPPPQPITSSFETSLHLALRSVEVALDLTGADGGHEAGENGPDGLHGNLDRLAVCVISLGQVEISGSESGTYVAGVLPQQRQQQGRGEWHVAEAQTQRQGDESQRVCSLVLGTLSVVLVDGSMAAAEATNPLAVQGSLSLISRSFAQGVFSAGGKTNGTRRLVHLGGVRMTAEILSKPPGDMGHGGVAWPAAVDGGARSAPEFLFNASLESMEVCASVGAVVLALHSCLLARKIGGEFPEGVGVGRTHTWSAFRRSCWLRGVRASFEGISVGGVVKSGGCQLTGNMRRLDVSRFGGGATRGRDARETVSEVAIFDELLEGDGEALSWTVDIADDAGLTNVKLTAMFKSASLHYMNGKKAILEMFAMTKEWTAGAARLAALSSSAVRRPKLVVEFEIRGLAVEFRLPFDLKLEVEDVHLGTPTVSRVAARERDNERAEADLDMNITTGDVRVFHHRYGAHFTPDDASPPAIRCAARATVAIRPNINVTSVSLTSEHVRVRLTPAFCASFGSFVRLMVGPPPRPEAIDAEALTRDRPPVSFNFKLDVRAVDVDFLTGPCNPSAVSAAFVVRGVSMRQHAIGAASSHTGSQASFRMSFEAAEATQQREPWRNAPALPKNTVRLVKDFLGETSMSGRSDAPGADVFLAWLLARKGAGGSRTTPGPVYSQSFLAALGRTRGAETFSVMTTSSGPRHRLVNSLSLRLSPVMLVAYPPTCRILVGHYNRFAANAFRAFRSRAYMPRKRIAVVTYDIDIRGCSAMLLASLADGARGIHLSAGEVTFKENTTARSTTVASPTGMGPSHPAFSSLSSVADTSTAVDTALSMSGFIGPVGIAFLQDWRSALPAQVVPGAGGSRAGEVASSVQLCAPIDVRWAAFYDELDRCRQDVTLSSVQFYLEQPHFDLCVRIAQIGVAADFPGALPPARAPEASGQPESAAIPAHGVARGSNNAQVDSFLATSLRLPLLQFVLANGKRSGPFPPVLEFDVASVRLVRGGTLTVRHLSVNSWSQDSRSPIRSVLTGDLEAERNGSVCGYRVLGRSGQSEESGKDFLRMEIRVPEVRPGTFGTKQAQLDIVLQVQPFDVHVNPSILRSLTAYIAPVPFVKGSPQEGEAPYPQRQPPLSTPCRSSGNPPSSVAHAIDRTAGEGATVFKRGNSAGERVSTDFEKSARTASASVRLLASQVTLELSSFPGGPAFLASTSHVFLRAITWPSDAIRARRGIENRAQAGPEVFARLSRVECRVRCGHEHGAAPTAETSQDDGPRGRSSSRSGQTGDTVLKPFDVDVHLTRPRVNAGRVAAVDRITLGGSAAQGWHAGVYVDELYLRFGPLHTRSLERLIDMFLPAVAAAETTAVELARGPRTRGTTAAKQDQSGGRIDDLVALDRLECAALAGRNGDVTPKPGQAVFYGVEAPRAGREEGTGGARAGGANPSETTLEEEGQDDDGWVHCCQWRYWGLRRVAQIGLPHALLRGTVPLLEGLVVDSLEVELSWVDPLTGQFQTATRFNVPCQASDEIFSSSFSHRSRVTVESAQPVLARTWRLSWRIPTWLKTKGASMGGTPKSSAISAWSSILLRSLSVWSSPASPMVGASYLSTTLVAQRLTLAVLTEGGLILSPSRSSPPRASPSERQERGVLLQLEEIVRVVVDDVDIFAEAGSAARWLSVAARGSAIVSVDVQDFSNFLRLPLLSHALVRFDVSSSGVGGGIAGGDQEDLLSPFRPVVSGAIDVHDAVVSVSVTAMQCMEQCIAELSQRPPVMIMTADGAGTRLGEDADPSKLMVPAFLPAQRQPRQRSKRYLVTNHTDRNLWFGQASTTETLLLRAGEETSYRWRTIPPVLTTCASGRKDYASRLVLMLRLALHCNSSSGNGSVGAAAGGGGDFGAWAEPFPADYEGTFMRLLRGAEAEENGGARSPGTSPQASDTVMLPLWVEVTKKGLETRITFQGEWVFTNHLPQEIQVAWVTSAGAGNAGRRLVEPPGTRGNLKLMACSGGSVEAGGVQHPSSCSAVTASSATATSSLSRTGQVQGGRFSELMLEFRLATPDSAAFVGSVGPPPPADGDPEARKMGRDGVKSNSGDGERGISERKATADLEGDAQGREEIDNDSTSSPWGVTRQSEWIQARPSVFLALISCASTNPDIPGFVFWCVASRHASHLNDCAPCVSGASGHRGHPAQTRIDLHPMALVWNRCSQPMGAMLNSRGGSGRWSEQRDEVIDSMEAKDSQARHGDEGVRGADRERNSGSTYSLSRSTASIQPGGRIAVCQQPFVDYDLAVTSTAMTERGPKKVLPFLVSVPSELLSRRCEATWLPLHSRALTDNVLCPLVVVASRLLDANWPSLSLRVYPGLSVRNHLSVPMFLRTVFTRPLLGDDGAPSTQPEDPHMASPAGKGEVDRVQDERQEQAAEPLLRRTSSGRGDSMPVSGDEHRGSAGSRVSRVFHAPAESCHSAWDMFQCGGLPIPFLLPDVSVELCLDSQDGNPLLPATSVTERGPLLVAVEEETEELSGSLAPSSSVAGCSHELKVSLEDDFNELVLIPWDATSGTVLPVFLRLEREVVLGGVELIRLAVYPRVVVHNGTGLPISLSLLSTSQATDGDEAVINYGNSAKSGALPLCRVRLTPEGDGSCMNLLAIPGKRQQLGLNGSHHRSASGVAGEGGRRGRGGGGDIPEGDLAPDTDPPPGLLGKLSRIISSASSKAASPDPAGFSADLEVAFGWDDGATETSPTCEGVPVERAGGPATSPIRDEEAASSEAPTRSHQGCGVDDLAVLSLHEPSAGSALICQPASLTVHEGRRRAARVCIAVDNPGPEPTSASPTCHVLLYQDAQPDLTIWNRSAGSVTLLFDCGALVEVGPGATAEHSWQWKSAARDRSGSGAAPSGGATGRRGRHRSDGSRGAGASTDRPGVSTPIPSAPCSPAAANVGAGAAPDARRSCASGPGDSPARRKARPPGKLGGDATLQHWFQCKGGSKDDVCLSWSDPLWVARGVQIMRFEGETGKGGDHEVPGYRCVRQGDGGNVDGGSGEGYPAGFGAGSAREVQVHIVERAGGFVMSFAEGGFEGAATDGVGGVESEAGDTAATETRGVLARWAATLEHHVVVSVSSTTIQLLDDSNLQAFAPGGKNRTSTASSAAVESLGVMDGWVGGTWEEPGGPLSDRASAHLPAAAIPAVISVFIDGSSVRLWRAAPAVRPGMSSLDIERSWHLTDRIGIDVCLRTLQIDNRVAGHSLPVLFCFRDKGCLIRGSDTTSGCGEDGGEDGEAREDSRFTMSLVLARSSEQSLVPSYVEKVSVRSAPIDVCFEDSLLPPLLLLVERAGVGGGGGDESLLYPSTAASGQEARPSARGVSVSEGEPTLLPARLSASMMPRLFIQRVDIGALVVRATVQGYIPGKQVFLALDKSPLLFRPVSLRGVLARPDEIAEQIASNYAVDALLRSLAVVGSLEALGSPTTLLSEWGKGVYDLFAMPIKAMPQGPSSTFRATFKGVGSLLRHASAGTLSSVSGVTNALSRNLGSRGRVVRPIAGTMGLVHRTSKSLIASTGVDSEWTHAKAATAANPATAYLNADLWYRCCLLPAGHEFLYRTPALCSNASYSEANVPVTIVLSSQAVFLYRGSSGCETLWKQIEHQDITLVEQSAEHAPAELILNARGYRRPKSSPSSLGTKGSATTTEAAASVASPPRARASKTGATGAAVAAGAAGATRLPRLQGNAAASTLEAEEVAVGGLLMKLSLPSSGCCHELAQLLHGLSGKA